MYISFLTLGFLSYFVLLTLDSPIPIAPPCNTLGEALFIPNITNIRICYKSGACLFFVSVKLPTGVYVENSTQPPLHSFPSKPPHISIPILSLNLVPYAIVGILNAI